MPGRTGHSGSVKSPGNPPVKRIVVADNDSLFRVGLREMLAGLHPEAVVDDANSGPTLAAALQATPAELCLFDLGLPGLGGYLEILVLRRRHPGTRFIAVSGLEMPLAAQRVLALGVAACVSKRAPPDKIARRVASNRRMPGRVPAREKKLIDGLLRLTPAEMQVFIRLTDKPSHRALMNALDIALPTVKTHMSRILQKLDLRNRTEAAIVAQRLSVFEARQLYIERARGRGA